VFEELLQHEFSQSDKLRQWCNLEWTIDLERADAPPRKAATGG
jgi:hypothetical protein